MYCLKNDKIETACCLINTPGVDLNSVNSDGNTPLMYCLKNTEEYGTLETARCLISTPGVDLDTVDRDGLNLEDITRSVSVLC